MTQRRVRECDQCHKEMSEGGKRYEFGGFVAVVNGRRDEAFENNETCSPACAEARFRALVQEATAKAERAVSKPDCHSIEAA